MKNLFRLIVYISVLFVFYIVFLNFSDILALKLYTGGENAEIIKHIGFGIFTLAVLAVGFLVGFTFVGQFYLALKDKFQAYKRELERSSITNSSGEAKISVLEAKIATLEKALDDALNK